MGTTVRSLTDLLLIPILLGFIGTQQILDLLQRKLHLGARVRQHGHRLYQIGNGVRFGLQFRTTIDQSLG
uniref:Putative secreted peptide n=1 Tax=Anopheles braziliensis TaxID=58242 RepID=A0A2M3ZS96_9DIPT